MKAGMNRRRHWVADAVIARIAFVSSGLGNVLPYQLAVCTAILVKPVCPAMNEIIVSYREAAISPALRTCS